ncbi:MAG: TIGR02452 family protein [Bacteroidales bacterium]|nr:TIGR02452 family protein [Bacteroidales bacterium]
MYYYDQKQRNVAIFYDSMELCRSDAALKQTVKASIAAQKIYPEGTDLPVKPVTSYETECEIVVSKKKTLEAAGGYVGSKVCVLNFASATSPGGGVKNGSNAQEENICRSTTLYNCLADHSISSAFHSHHTELLRNGKMNGLYNDDCIYTPGVCVFKEDHDDCELLDRSDWFSIDVITCAAPNLRERPSNAMNPNAGSKRVTISDADLEALHEKRLDRILDIAALHGAEVVILGAFGCGAFKNPPQAVACGMYRAVQRHLHDFKTIEFAIYCRDYETENYNAFRSVFSPLCR